MDKPNLEKYFEACSMFEQQESLDHFRNHPAIRGITDTNTLEHAIECEMEIMREHGYLLPWMDTFRCVDSLGMPILYQFRHVGLFNPTTLRHIITLARICMWYREPIHSVCEIGGSYGVLAALLSLYTSMEQYFGLEPEPVGNLAFFYLSKLGLARGIAYFEPMRPFQYSYDIVVSCYAFSELDREEQDWYIDNVLLNARAGFLVMNSCKNGYPRLEMIQRLENELHVKVHCEREIPLTHKDNYTLMWRQG